MKCIQLFMTKPRQAAIISFVSGFFSVLATLTPEIDGSCVSRTIDGSQAPDNNSNIKRVAEPAPTSTPSPAETPLSNINHEYDPDPLSDIQIFVELNESIDKRFEEKKAGNTLLTWLTDQIAQEWTRTGNHVWSDQSHRTMDGEMRKINLVVRSRNRGVRQIVNLSSGRGTRASVYCTNIIFKFESFIPRFTSRGPGWQRYSIALRTVFDLGVMTNELRGHDYIINELIRSNWCRGISHKWIPKEGSEYGEGYIMSWISTED